jgi:hypothetical protein
MRTISNLTCELSTQALKNTGGTASESTPNNLPRDKLIAAKLSLLIAALSASGGSRGWLPQQLQ